MKDIIITIIGIVIVGFMIYGGWLIKREINYSLDYKDKVIETIKEQNKPLVARILILENKIKELEKR